MAHTSVRLSSFLAATVALSLSLSLSPSLSTLPLYLTDDRPTDGRLTTRHSVSVPHCIMLTPEMVCLQRIATTPVVHLDPILSVLCAPVPIRNVRALQAADLVGCLLVGPEPSLSS